LKAVGISVAGDTRRQRGRDALVITEIALACTLLIGSGLVLRSLWKLLSTDPGFDSSRVLTVQLSLPEYKYHGMPKMEAYRDELLRRVRPSPVWLLQAAAKRCPSSEAASRISSRFRTRPAVWLTLRPPRAPTS
jgi:hypothetical protein